MGIQQALARRRARLRFLPPYSPDLLPVERCWLKLKAFLGTAEARTRAALDGAMTQALTTETESDARNWFTHCGYALQ